MTDVFLSPISKQELIGELLTGFRDILRDQQKEALNQKEWLTVREVADLLKISQVTVHAYAKRGRLIKHKIGTRTRFKKDEVLNAVQAIESSH